MVPGGSSLDRLNLNDPNLDPDRLNPDDPDRLNPDDPDRVHPNPGVCTGLATAADISTSPELGW
jgi:hypothetical protein